MNICNKKLVLLPYLLSAILIWMCTGWGTITASSASAAAASTTLTINTSTNASNTNQVTKVTFDGVSAQWSTEEPIIYKGTAYVSLQEAAQHLNAKVSWNTKKHATELYHNGDTILHRSGTSTFTINQYTSLQASSPSLSKNGTTMVPLRTLAEALKANVAVTRENNHQTINVSHDTVTIISKQAEAANNYLINQQYSGLALIARHGEILMRKGYGLSEENKLVRPDRSSRIASLTKSFTAASIMKLVEEGKLELTDSLESYIPGLENGDQITIHMLLSHTSGITSNFPREKGMTLHQTIEAIKDKPLSFKPGSDFKYSNSGYMLLGSIIEQASGMSYGDYVSENFLQPLGMDHTGEAAATTPTIKGYISANGAWKIAGEYNSQSGSGTLYSTLDDLLKWDAALNNEETLNQSSLDKMFTPYSYKNYGYGWMIDNEQTPEVLFHNGSGTGYSTGISRNLGGGLTIILLGNQAGRDTITFMKEIRNIMKQ
ncbi:CubicO group peptidase (beta-lactamase class C family) [Fontibacillus solani]|uniref:CubicO group peptidase (Beta-lactamase class C family) n=1 Tax=Fontibacillus solani TaxID=1572857 RepID=A0A7W3SYC4_9BACL|nr:serine hydrolase [Fontibacillus solani]MBA9088494.1 CubicO group peptidase (beta-lactamase class C family) [Fontibacillus solani]